MRLKGGDREPDIKDGPAELDEAVGGVVEGGGITGLTGGAEVIV